VLPLKVWRMSKYRSCSCCCCCRPCCCCCIPGLLPRLCHPQHMLGRLQGSSAAPAAFTCHLASRNVRVCIEFAPPSVRTVKLWKGSEGQCRSEDAVPYSRRRVPDRTVSPIIDILLAVACAVKYEIRVKGSAEVVASSPANGAEFPLSAAGPLRAFGVALPTMKRGEAANLLVRSDCAYSFHHAKTLSLRCFVNDGHEVCHSTHHATSHNLLASSACPHGVVVGKQSLHDRFHREDCCSRVASHRPCPEVLLQVCHAQCLCAPADGFSDAERPASVPADAELEVQLELVSWNSVEDVTGDGAVVKKVWTRGSD